MPLPIARCRPITVTVFPLVKVSFLIAIVDDDDAAAAAAFAVVILFIFEFIANHFHFQTLSFKTHKSFE